MLDNVELTMFMKFQKILMTGTEIWTKTSKMPLTWVFSSKIFFKNQALLLLYPYGVLTSCKILENTNEQSLRYLKTDGQIKAITMEPIW